MKSSCQILMLLIGLISFTVSAAWEVKDDFSGYKNGSDAAPAWQSTGIYWEVLDGALANADPNKDFAFPRDAHAGRKVVAEATVTIESSLKADWKTAGLVIEQDGDNYWQFSLVEAPEALQKKHFVEFAEMVKGNWNAQSAAGTRLTSTEYFGGGFSWHAGKTYRMRLEMSEAGIKGELSEADGTVRVRIAYRFDAPAVVSGRPGLANGGFKASFRKFSARVEAGALAVKPRTVFPPCPVAGNPALKDQPTGFFRVARKNGKWWLFTPQGEAFYAVGIDHVNYTSHWCEKLGYAPMHRFAAKKYGSEEAWGRTALKRLQDWNFNTLTAGHSPSLRHQKLAHIEFLNLGAEFANADTLVPKEHWTGFPNVFSPRFQKFCEKKAERLCGAMKDDPWLVGYFIDNELDWFGKAPKGNLRNWALGRPEGDPARLAAEQTDADGFVRLLAEKYFAMTTAAIRKYDPNHLILGCRFAGDAPADIWDVCGNYCDVVTVNVYPRVDLETGDTSQAQRLLETAFSKAKKPLMVTEWSFPALDAVDSEGKPLPSMHGAGMRVDTQEQKTRCCEIMQTRLFTLPFMVGSDYFMWGDEPALGISSGFPEDSNYGLVSESDQPYELLTRMFARVNAQVYQLHNAPPDAARPLPKPAGATTPPKGKIMVEQAGKALTIDNGMLKLVRLENSGNLWDRVELQGVVLGNFSAVIQRQTGGNEWIHSDRLESLKVTEDDSKVIVDMVLAGEKCFRTAYRLTIYPRQDFFLSQLLWLENIDAKPWKWVCYYHYANGFIGGSPEGTVLGGVNVPNYYLPVGAWKNDRIGKQYGVIAPHQQDFDIFFWLDENRGQHPDARRKIDWVMQPGERFTERQPAIIVFGAPANEKLSDLAKRIRALDISNSNEH